MKEIQDTLYLQVETVATALGVPFKVPNKSFTPPADNKWLEIVHIPNGPAYSGFQDMGNDQGMLNVGVHWTPDVGDLGPTTAQEAVAAAFAQGTRLFSVPPGIVVEIYTPPRLGGALEDGQNTFYPVSIMYRSFKS